VSFVKTGWLSDSKSFAGVKGQVFDASGKLKIKMSGNWTTALYEDVGKGKRKLIWAVEKRPYQSASQSHNLTKWEISLNSPAKDEERDVVAPTDSRLRPDQRALENGQYELATKYKVALEEGQRECRRVLDEAGEKWELVWFKKELDPVAGRAKGCATCPAALGDIYSNLCAYACRVGFCKTYYCRRMRYGTRCAARHASAQIMQRQTRPPSCKYRVRRSVPVCRAG